MIIIRTPFRVSLFGGSTDYESFYSRHGSLCIGATIDKYTYASLRFRPKVVGHESIISYSSLDKTLDHSSIGNPLIRETLKKFNIQNAIDLHLFGDMPSRTGLGGSSSCCVGLCHAVRKLLNLPIDKKTIALDAIDIERKILNEPGGIQDQIWAAYGGLNSIEIEKDGCFHVRPLPVSQDFINDFEASIFLVYTNTQREINDIALSHDSQGCEDIKLSIREISQSAYGAFCSQDIPSIGKLMLESWNEKKRISNFICTPEIDSLEEFLLQNKIFGLKLLGSGGSGFMAVLCDKKDKKTLVESIEKKYPVLDLRVEFSGSDSVMG